MPSVFVALQTPPTLFVWVYEPTEYTERTKHQLLPVYNTRALNPYNMFIVSREFNVREEDRELYLREKYRGRNNGASRRVSHSPSSILFPRIHNTRIVKKQYIKRRRKNNRDRYANNLRTVNLELDNIMLQWIQQLNVPYSVRSPTIILLYSFFIIFPVALTRF